MKSTLVINNKPPYSSQTTKESLDAALATAAFGVEVGLLFVGDGIFQLLRNQNPNSKDLKRTAPIFNSLALYEISQVYVYEEDLVTRGLKQQDLLIDTTLIASQDLAGLLAAYDNLLTF